MADERTTRLGLPVYTSGSSAHPVRQDFNDRMELLDEQVVVKRTGALDDRPLPGDIPAGVVWEQTDAPYDLWWNTGQEWLQFARIGHGGAGRPLAIGGSGAEGTSNRAARGDHTHPLPLASASQDGALSASDKAMLNTATSNATGSSLARRNGSGQMSTANPTSAQNATNKQYVDGQVSAVSEVASGALQLSELRTRDLDTVTEDGIYKQYRNSDATADRNYPPGLEAAGELRVYRLQSGWGMQIFTHYTGESARRSRGSGGNWGSWRNFTEDIDEAAWDGGPGTLVRRSGIQSRIQVGDPSAAEDATTKRYVDDEVDALVEGRRLITSSNLFASTESGVEIGIVAGVWEPILGMDGWGRVTVHFRISHDLSLSPGEDAFIGTLNSDWEPRTIAAIGGYAANNAAVTLSITNGTRVSVRGLTGTSTSWNLYFTATWLT